MPGMNWKRLSVLACAVALNPVTALLAQDLPSAGVVRISDRAVKPAGMQVPGQFHAMPAAAMMGQPHGGFGGDCPECYGGGGKHGGSGSFKERYCTHSPDHGFSVPGKWPIHRRGVQYTNFYPHTWAGTEGPAVGEVPQYPMAYMPTDTTQLGFYSQHVPFWQPQPNPMPRRPIPAQWHHYAPTVYASDWGNSYYKGGMNGANCPVVSDGTVIHGTPTPIAQPAAPVQAAPEAPKPLPPGPDGA
ncbi:MAG: hypothetical protein Q8K78_09825 [Planctomycetaceae bacterium]|nr:hypothetical protein [Planctomycetaceae bacterium]